MIAEDDLLPYLRSDDRNVQLAALRSVKNSVIGHSDQKATYLDRGVLDDLLAIIGTPEDGIRDAISDECRIQAGVILGSFAYSDPEISSRLFTPATLSTLVKVLTQYSPPGLLVASLRTLTTLLTLRLTPSLVNQFPGLAKSLSELISHYSPADFAKFTRLDVQVLTSLCTLVPLISPSHSSVQSVSVELTAPLFDLVYGSLKSSQTVGIVFDSKLQSAAILALAHVLTPTVAHEIETAGPSFTSPLLALLRAPDTATRLSAASLLTAMYTCGKPESTSNSGVTRAQQITTLALTLVPTLMKLLDDGIAADHHGRKCDPTILHTLAILCREGGEVTDRCVEAGLIKKIVSIIAQLAPNDHFTSRRILESESKLLSSSLLCLSALGLYNEDYRKEIIEAGALSVVVAVMNTANTAATREVKIAACHVLRTLSRSVRLLRTTMVESGVVCGIVDLLGDAPPEEERPLLENVDNVGPEPEHMDDEPVQTTVTEVPADEDEEEGEDLEVRTAAMAAVCNLVLDFSPLRKPILDKGILPLVVSGARSRYTPLRLNSTWALKHMVFGDDMDTKACVMSHLGFPLVIKLCDDKEIQVQEQALDFLRNLTARSETYIDMLFDNVGVDEVFRLLDRKLSLVPVPPLDESEQELLSTQPYYTKVIIATAYVIVHIAAGYDRHREIVIAHEDVLRKIVQLMRHENYEVRLACVWTIINLTWVEEPNRAPDDVASSAAGQVPAVAPAGAGQSSSPSDTMQQDQGISAFTELYFADIYRRRAMTLVRLGVREQLEHLKQDPVLDVREKTKTAIYQIDSLVGGASPSAAADVEPDIEAGLSRGVEVPGGAMEIDSELHE
ncbi:armadillo-type protein [Lipomyces kononenkoae]|uniref:Armadillo-type protein n=1 Tax=Lipomyces kononenkoae TaxID=34357 RepID=A0ACC3T3E8_LIPKO